MANAQVTTTGVVTAAYPRGTGNFSGFYLQTAGHDAANDLTPNASDGIFVFTGSLAIAPAVGDKVTVTGKVTEFSGMTEITVSSLGNFTNAGPATGADLIKPGTVLPGTDCALPGTGCLTGAALEAEREKHEGEVFQPTAPFTVSDSYDGTPWSQAGSRGFQMAGEIGLAANDTEPLMAPTQVVNPANAAGLAARNAYNNAHMITLDDGANVDYSSTTSLRVPVAHPDPHGPDGCGRHVPEARRPRLPQRPLEAAAAGQGDRRRREPRLHRAGPPGRPGRRPRRHRRPQDRHVQHAQLLQHHR